MDRSFQVFSLLLLLAVASTASAQVSLPCGIVDIDGPSHVDEGTRLVFKTRVTGNIQTTKPEFKWTLSVGTITAGQGTDEITVDTDLPGGQAVTATVELLGAPAGCRTSASRTTEVNRRALVCGLPFDQYGDINFEDEKARLDNFAIQLMNQPLSSGIILMSAGKETFENETAERLNRAKSYVVNVRGIEPNRIVTLDCGFSQDLSIKMYIVPVGAIFPECNIFEAVPFSEVRFTKRRPQASKKRRKIRRQSFAIQ